MERSVAKTPPRPPKAKTMKRPNYRDIFEQYEFNDKAFLFLDPPYLLSENSTYIQQDDEKDMTSILIDIFEFLKTCTCKVMLIP